MIIKRQYETIGMLLQRDPKAKTLMVSACEGIDEYYRRLVLNPDNEIILHDADLGCGIPGDRYIELMKKLDELDSTKPYKSVLIQFVIFKDQRILTAEKRAQMIAL